MNRQQNPPSSHDLLNDSLPLLTETVSEPDIPLLSEVVNKQARQHSQQIVDEFCQRIPTAEELQEGGVRLEVIHQELQASARLIMQEVIDEYMLQIETELHRRLEEHLAMLLCGGQIR